MKALADFAPFTVHSLGASPWPGFWPMNPSLLRTPDGRWLCSIRCANYHLPGSTIAPDAQPARLCNRNLMATLDPETWRVVDAVEMIDRDAARGAYRSSPTFGFEDLRLAWTERDGLTAIANTMVLNDTGTLEIAHLALDPATFEIVGASALRGSSWAGRHQKNWQPIMGEQDLRMLYSVQEGGIHDRHGRIVPCHKPIAIDDEDPTFGPEVIEAQQRASRPPPFRRYASSMEVSIVATRGRHAAPKQKPMSLRGGTQLLQIGDEGNERYLGLAHGCHVGVTKMYWHRFVWFDDLGVLRALSEPFKIDPLVGIEFAAGLALDLFSENLVISYGIEDDSAWLGTFPLRAALDMLHPLPVVNARGVA